MNKYLLAIHEDTNANVTLFKGRQILFSVAEERLSRLKYHGGFPCLGIKLVLTKYNLKLKDLDLITAANKYHFLPRILGTKFPNFEHSFLGIPQKAFLLYNSYLTKNRFLANSVENFNQKLLELKFRKRVVLIDHHRCHAASAYFTSGFTEALAVSCDNFGDGYSTTVFECKNRELKFLYGSTALNSPGQFYGLISQVALGFHPLAAGKTTGLAAFGNPDKAYDLVASLFNITKDKKDFILSNILFLNPRSKVLRYLSKFRKEDIAAAVQKRLEDILVEYVTHALKETNMKNLVLSGGVFGNVRVNQKLAQFVKNIFVHPGMSDQGLSLGAGLDYLANENGLEPFSLQDVFWGPAYSDQEIRAILSEYGLKYEFIEDIETKMALLLSQGKVVARFHGRLEYGPRALGNRSILYQTTDFSVNDWLNKKLKREHFMPFAPVTLAEFADKCYLNIKGAEYTAKFMTISFDCTEWMKNISPAVVHVDGTARPQFLAEEDNPIMYRILSQYYKKTGIPSLLNTSFNIHEEPIVCSPKDAVEAFIESQLDYLAIGNFLVPYP